jgi:hypothetical protein
VFFVDAGYILALRREMARAPALRREYDAVCRQVAGLPRAGHQVQLHIHPHWEDSRWNGTGWDMDLRRYALQSFAPAQIGGIVARYVAVLRELAGADAAFAYRAGGWVVQPFEPIRAALLANGVTIDSSVYADGVCRNPVQPHDFRGAPRKSRWRFDSDPLVEADGPFTEIPIASMRVPPAFYWELAMARKLGGARHRAFGDGTAVAMEGGDLRRKLTRATTSVVSIDGYKARLLEIAAREYRARGMQDFVVIGHPKALTPYSLERLDSFLANGARVATFADFPSPRPTPKGEGERRTPKGERERRAA